MDARAEQNAKTPEAMVASGVQDGRTNCQRRSGKRKLGKGTLVGRVEG